MKLWKWSVNSEAIPLSEAPNVACLQSSFVPFTFQHADAASTQFIFKLSRPCENLYLFIEYHFSFLFIYSFLSAERWLLMEACSSAVDTILETEDAVSYK